MGENADYEDFIGLEPSVRKKTKKLEKSAYTDNLGIDIWQVSW